MNPVRKAGTAAAGAAVRAGQAGLEQARWVLEWRSLTAIAETDLTKRFGKRVAVDRVSISVPSDFGRKVMCGEHPQILIEAEASAAQRLDAVVHRRYNPEGLTQYNIVPGLPGVILQMTMVMMPAMALTGFAVFFSLLALSRFRRTLD